MTVTAWLPLVFLPRLRWTATFLPVAMPLLGAPRAEGTATGVWHVEQDASFEMIVPPLGWRKLRALTPAS
jgi:hypothetical protein